MSDESISIVPLALLLNAPQAVSELDFIFFEASSRQLFSDDKEKAFFRERWLGRYLREDAEHGFAAVTSGGAPSSGPEQQSRIIAYVVGSYENPARAEQFADIAYYEAFESQCSRFPAHLHINSQCDFRGRGIGSKLVDAFCNRFAQSEQANSAGMEGGGRPGVHVVTSAGARNVGFYHRNGFQERARLNTGADTLVFLGREPG